MLLAEGPICCVGTVALLVVILGVVIMLAGRGPRDIYYEDEEYEAYESYQRWEQEEEDPSQGVDSGESPTLY
jgi:hypothetical protein